MKHIPLLFLPILLVIGMPLVSFSQDPQGPTREVSEKAGDGRCYYNGTLSEQHRRKIFPFNKAAKVVVIAFDCVLQKAPLAHDSIEVSKVIEKIELSDEQINGLTDILYNYNFAEEAAVFSIMDACDRPQHAIVFLDKADKVIAYIELCFANEARRTTLPNKSIGSFCHGKFDLIKSLFQKAGITYFKQETCL
jgi:hypothetical protein